MPSRRQRPSLLRIFGEGYAYSQNSFTTTVLNGCRINHVAITHFVVDDLFPCLVNFTGFDQLDRRVDFAFGAFDAGFAIPPAKCLPIREMRERMSSNPRSPASRRLRSIRRHFVSGSGAQVLGAFLRPVAEM